MRPQRDVHEHRSWDSHVRMQGQLRGRRQHLHRGQLVSDKQRRVLRERDVHELRARYELVHVQRQLHWGWPHVRRGCVVCDEQRRMREHGDVHEHRARHEHVRLQLGLLRRRDHVHTHQLVPNQQRRVLPARDVHEHRAGYELVHLQYRSRVQRGRYDLCERDDACHVFEGLAELHLRIGNLHVHRWLRARRRYGVVQEPADPGVRAGALHRGQ